MTESGRNVLKVALVVSCGVAAYALSAGWFSPASRDEVVEAAPRPSASRIGVAAMQVQAEPTADDQPQSRLAPESRNNPFGPLNLLPPASASVGLPAKAKPAPPKAVPPPPPPPPVAPTAPPLPFVALGSIEGADVTAGQKLAFLQQQENLLVVRKGESIGQLYRVEDVSSDRVELTYLPMNQRQSLSFAH